MNEQPQQRPDESINTQTQDLHEKKIEILEQSVGEEIDPLKIFVIALALGLSFYILPNIIIIMFSYIAFFFILNALMSKKLKDVSSIIDVFKNPKYLDLINTKDIEDFKEKVENL